MLLIRTIDNDDFHVSQIVKMVEKDPGITATVIKHANSARFGFSSQVSSVEDAIRMLGFKNLRSIALGASVASSVIFDSDRDQATFWRWSEVAGSLSQAIAELAKVDKSSAWLVGFTMRIGEQLIAQYDREVSEYVKSHSNKPGERWERQLQMFGMTEGEVVAELTGAWNFPPDIVSGLRASGRPMCEDWPFFPLAAVAHTAGLFADGIVAGQKDAEILVSECADPAVASSINVTTGQLFEVVSAYIGQPA